ncbi:MAG TPA: phosphatase PAP2 family protein [Patescibacteria group bacterium]|jgi:undecaprenyl-diphosphatase|nr:phosphatase PAP2 family protein [Patescibacteria group bacterium]
MDSIIIFCAQYLYLIIGFIAGIYWLTLPKKQKLRMVLFGIIAMATAFAMAKFAGMFYFDPRPFVTQNIAPLFPHVADNGFPSDHTLLTATIAVIIYSASKKLGLVLMAMAIIVGLSRILAHVHSPIDIVGSLAFAVASGLLAYYLTNKLISKFA